MEQNQNNLPRNGEELRRALVTGKAVEECRLTVSTGTNPVRIAFPRAITYVDLDADTAERLGRKLMEEAERIRKAGS